MIDKALLKQAINKWGEETQMTMCQEECAELIVALAHYLRNRWDSEKPAIEEIADVKIMIAQMEMIFGEDRVDLVVEQKLSRLKYRLENNLFEGEEVKK